MVPVMDKNTEMSQTNYITTDVLNRMSLTLDYDLTFDKGDIVPKLWHWLFFLPHVKASEEGIDGHPKTGGFIPVIEGLDRRMWAGSRFWFRNELYASKYAHKNSRVVSVTEKEGRSGRLGFVLVRHEYYQDDRHILSEEHDIVYKQTPKSETTVAGINATLSAPAKTAQWSETIKPSPVLLFKYSALTFNGHRIHYDRDFCKNNFGFPGLVVHGPLIANLLIELIRKNMADARVLQYSFRIKGPIFDFQTFKVEGCRKGDIVSLWTVNDSGLETVSAQAKITTQTSKIL
jgi:3-methylfumaryl-CoA hydratase